MTTPPQDECDINLRIYTSTSDCISGFPSKHTVLHSIIADGECHDSGSGDLGFYIATCDGDTNLFQLSVSGCTDNTCSDCAEAGAFSGVNREGGCLIDWMVNDLNKSGSVYFPAVADGKCHHSEIDGLGHYVARCQDDGLWFKLSKSGCTDETCSECARTSENKISTDRNSRSWPSSTLAFGAEPRCDIDAFYQEKVWSVSGSCQRKGCAGFPAKWWPKPTDNGTSIQCIYGGNYPGEYHMNDKLKGSLLFDSQEDCCDAYTRVAACQPTPSPRSPPDVVLENTTLENNGALLNMHSSVFRSSISFIFLLLRRIL